MKFSIAVLPGDGIGPEVIGEATKVLNAVARRFGHDFEIEEGRVGGNAIDEFGTPLPEATEELISDTDAVLFGAVGGPKWDDPRAKTRPEDGILAMRKMLGLYGNVRPVKVYPQLINTSPIKPEVLKDVDMIILRELTGGLYFAKPKRRWVTSRGRRGVDTLRYTEQEIERILRMAFEMAMGRRKLVTSVDKANVMETSRLWREIAVEVAKDFPEVELEHILVDTAAMQLLKNPAHYDVVVSENMFGDILSDEASVLSGSMGMQPSASLAGLPRKGRRGKRAISLYEPIHGSAPDIAGQGIANPISTILSMAMLLRYSLSLEDEAAAVERSVEGALAEGYRTLDIAADGGEVVKTTAMGDIIAGGV